MSPRSLDNCSGDDGFLPQGRGDTLPVEQVKLLQEEMKAGLVVACAQNKLAKRHTLLW